MNTIVAGQRIVTVAEFVEVALGFDFDLGDPIDVDEVGFRPGLDDLKDLAEFVEDVTDPSNSQVDAENALHYRELTTNVRVLARRRRTIAKAVAA